MSVLSGATANVAGPEHRFWDSIHDDPRENTAALRAAIEALGHDPDMDLSAVIAAQHFASALDLPGLGGWAIGSIAYSPVAVIRAVVEAVIGIAQLPTAELIVLGISFGLALPLAFAAGGYISGSFAFLIGGTLIAVAFKYILILLTYIFGAALGILVYINLLLGTMGVLLIHAFHFLREARETTAGIKAGIKAAEAAKNILS